MVSSDGAFTKKKAIDAEVLTSPSFPNVSFNLGGGGASSAKEMRLLMRVRFQDSKNSSSQIQAATQTHFQS